MQYLRRTQINGPEEEVNRIKRLFGEIYFGQLEHLPDKSVVLTLAKVLPNFYQASDASVKNAPLYVLVPEDCEITMVWPGKGFDNMKYGSATDDEMKIIAPAIAVQKGRSGIYLCLKPLGKEEINKIEFGALGI